MTKKIKPLPERGGKKIRLKIDMRTVITVRSEEALKSWLSKYPKAVVLDS